jgi:hypothetical protein
MSTEQFKDRFNIVFRNNSRTDCQFTRVGFDALSLSLASRANDSALAGVALCVTVDRLRTKQKGATKRQTDLLFWEGIFASCVFLPQEWLYSEFQRQLEFAAGYLFSEKYLDRSYLYTMISKSRSLYNVIDTR